MMTPLDDKSTIDIPTIWDRYFEVVLAISPEILDQVYSLRFQVYCVEHHFENSAMYPGGRETDCYDSAAQHVALLDRASGAVIGTGRLILPRAFQKEQLPLLSLLGADALSAFQQFPLDEMGEISRYVVSKSFRRRKGEEELPDVGYSPSDVQNTKRAMPYLTLGLIRGLIELGVRQEVRYFCACMRPALLRLLRNLGFEFKAIGPLVDYHGLRQPCVAAVDDLLSGLKGLETMGWGKCPIRGS
jgi:N-acyl amino acid synthase of PEP-CTERM/exosortase system